MEFEPHYSISGLLGRGGWLLVDGLRTVKSRKRRRGEKRRREGKGGEERRGEKIENSTENRVEYRTCQMFSISGKFTDLDEISRLAVTMRSLPSLIT